MALEEMHPLKYYDVLGEECLNRLDSISPPIIGDLPRSRSTTENLLLKETCMFY
jgi:hypothetical protein